MGPKKRLVLVKLRDRMEGDGEDTEEGGCLDGESEWVGGWVGWMEENEAVRMSCCGLWMDRWVGGTYHNGGGRRGGGWLLLPIDRSGGVGGGGWEEDEHRAVRPSVLFLFSGESCVGGWVGGWVGGLNALL